MSKKYNELYKFVKCYNPFIINIWDDFNNRKDPNPGDLFKVSLISKVPVYCSVLHTMPVYEMEFVKVEYDPEFKNGVAFYYIFNKDGEEYKIHSINDVDDPTKLESKDFVDLYGFWTHCEPINEIENK